MTSSRLVFSALAASLLLTGIYNLKTNAQPSLNWVEQSLGSYQSQIWAGGNLVSGTTEFRKTSNGYVEGSYTMDEEGELVPGTLSQCRATQESVMRCVWNDRYGTGNLEVSFSADFSKFYGYWGEENSEPAFRWSGSR